MSIAITPPTVVSRGHARTGGHLKKSGKLHGYARVRVFSDADANNLENQRRVLPDCERSSRTWAAGPLGTGPG